jgi:hypothetical protein
MEHENLNTEEAANVLLVAGLFIKLNKMFNNNQIQKVEIDQEKKKLYVYYIQDNSHLMSNPPPPPSYYREVFSFDNLEFIEKEYAKVERSFEKVTWS